MTRAEHLRWAKDRALDLARSGDVAQAYASLVSDLGKHPDTAFSQQFAIQLGGPLLLSGHLSRLSEMENFIEGFN